MSYTVRYDERVAKDVARLDKVAYTRIRKAIENKLQTQPELFGKPLRHSLVGVRTLRVGAYRIVFIIKGQEVHILLIGDRTYIYKEAEERLD